MDKPGIAWVFSYYSGTDYYAHFTAIFALLITRRRTLEKNKAVGIFPQLLLTSVCVTVILLGIYMNFENPAYRRLEYYNSEVVTSFAALVENRDNSTGGHIKRTARYVNIILDKMVKSGRYKKILTKDYITNVINAAPMHDIGKIATPDAILQKPGKLTKEEYDIMKKHAAQGGKIIEETFGELDEPEFLKIAYEVARFHHEKWNGTGYPDGLSQEGIPLHSRVMAIADVFDAVSAKRCYRDAMPLDDCFRIIEEGAGADFDPYLAGLFIDARQEIFLSLQMIHH